MENYDGANMDGGRSENGEESLGDSGSRWDDVAEVGKIMFGRIGEIRRRKLREWMRILRKMKMCAI